MRLPTLVAFAGFLSVFTLAWPQTDQPSLQVASAQPSEQAASHDGHNALPHSVVFFSPNTIDTLSDADAMSALKSFDEANAIAVADRAACALGNVAEVDAAIGIFESSAENIVLMQGGWDRATTGYLAVLMGRYEHQEWAFWFTADANGKEKLWLIRSAASATGVARQIRAEGLTPASVIVSARETVVVIVESEKDTARIERLAEELHGTAASEPGTSGRIGSDVSSGIEGERAAVPLYDAAIARFERTRRVALAKKLWTAEWHDATARSCTAGNQATQISVWMQVAIGENGWL